MTGDRAEAPFLRIRRSALSAILLTCEHASNRLPMRDRLTFEERSVLSTHWGWDIGAWALTREISRLAGYGAIGGRWSRLLIDLNRRVDDPTLIRDEAEGVRLSWNRRVTPAEKERRMLAYHTPYHVEIDRSLLRRLVRGTRPVLVAVHSFTPVMHHRPRNFDIGVLYDEHVHLARRLGRALRDAGFRVRYNEPYSGIAGMMYAADRHGSHHDLPCLEIEVNQTLLDRPDRIRPVAAGLAPCLRRLEA